LDAAGDLSDAYAAQMEPDRRAGWDDNAVDDYNRYHEYRSKQRPGRDITPDAPIE
jgi:hypothetical protein